MKGMQSPTTTSTTPSRTRSVSRDPFAGFFAQSPRISADVLRLVKEPVRWCLDIGARVTPDAVALLVRSALRGPSEDRWTPPAWLLPHQQDAARRIAARRDVFRGALLADAVG